MIEIQNLAVKYGDFTAVSNLNLTINEGEFFTFLGPSGCGKTTTLRSIAGFEKLAEGKIQANEIDLSKLLPEERNIGFVFQNYALFPSMSVYENIAFGLKAHKAPKDKVREKVASVAEKIGIEEHLNKKISELSGGQQQRIAVARALVMEPGILLMDEPLSNLDAKLRISMREEIKRLQQDLNITTIYVTHDQEEALAISDRIAVFNKGKIEQIGTPTEIYNSPNTEYAAKFIGDINYLEGIFHTAVVEQTGISPNAHVYLRPQHMKVLRKENIGAAEIRIPATVDSFEFLGTYIKVCVSAPESGRMECVLFNQQDGFSISDEVFVSFEKKDLLIFEEGALI